MARMRARVAREGFRLGIRSVMAAGSSGGWRGLEQITRIKPSSIASG